MTLMHDFGTTILCCTPSYAMFLGEAMKECEYPREEFKLKVGVFGAEPWTEKMRKKLEESLGIKAYDIYGLSEIAGPGVGYECEHQCGTHLNEDLFYPEILNPETGEPMPEGQLGELTFTHLTKEGMPLLRYRTHDLTALHYDKCKCGRTLVRMDRILGRCDDMLIIRGVNVFPSQIEDVILKLPEYEPHFLLTVDRVNNTDTSELKVEVKEEYFTDDMATLVGLQKKLEAELRSVIGLGFKVKLVEPKGIERSEGKAKRVIDKRKIKNQRNMLAKQLSVFLENKSGRLTEVTDVLGAAGVNLSAMSIADNSDFGILRCIVSDPDKAYQVLKAAHFAVKITDVIGFTCPNVSGSLAKVLKYLSENGVFIEYMYSFANGDAATVVIRPTDLESCERILSEKKVELMEANELYQL